MTISFKCKTTAHKKGPDKTAITPGCGILGDKYVHTLSDFLEASYQFSYAHILQTILSKPNPVPGQLREPISCTAR